MNDLLLWLVLILLGFVAGVVFTLLLMSGRRSYQLPPTMLMAPAPPPVTVEGSGCLSPFTVVVLLLLALFLLWLWFGV